MAEHRCTCGYSTGDADELTDHFLEQFTPDDDRGVDGEVHYEGIGKLACVCGFMAAAIAELDAHFLGSFVPVGRVGLDGGGHTAAGS